MKSHAEVCYGHVIAREELSILPAKESTYNWVKTSGEIIVFVPQTRFAVTSDKPEPLPFQYVNKQQKKAFTSFMGAYIPRLKKVEPQWILSTWSEA
jgi:hypothetical protein